jgi:hypothetical protein
MSKTHILIRLLQMYIPQNWEFGPAFSKLGISRGRGRVETPPWVCQWYRSLHRVCTQEWRFGLDSVCGLLSFPCKAY